MLPLKLVLLKGQFDPDGLDAYKGIGDTAFMPSPNPPMGAAVGRGNAGAAMAAPGNDIAGKAATSFGSPHLLHLSLEA